MSHPTWINAPSRRRGLERLADHPVDVAVVGGGITGVGVALDAASRGLSVALLEGEDLGSGTSGYSSKLVHGGLRYLARMDLAVAWESAVERHRLMSRIAPHLIHPLAFVIPELVGTPRGEAALTGAGVGIYDLLRRAAGTRGSVLPRPQLLSAPAVSALVPALDPTSVRRGLVYWDGQVNDDVRLVLAVARTAAGLGAHVLRDIRATRMTDSAVEAVDCRTGQSLTVRAGTVVNATGVWAADFAPELTVTASRGTHLVVPAGRLGHPRVAHTVAVPGHFGRYVFLLPQPSGYVYIGLTDEEDRSSDGHRPTVPDHDVEFLLRIVNTTLGTPLTREDVVGTFAGLRPLVRPAGSPPDAGTADISRRHLVRDVPGEPITVVGGKLTTYRRMAQEAVDAVAARLGVDRRSRTARMPLVGAAGPAELAGVTAPRRLVDRYGTEAPRVQALSREEPWLAEEIVEGTGFTGAELLFGVLAEGAATVEDLLARRTRLAFAPEDADRAKDAAERVLELAAGPRPAGVVPPTRGPGAGR
ncbi:glycerol-3-phosphate dehydrogenase/oxidase [Cellulosimicrobium funkei]|nr:glycerol-3-phosphate dehydrogenase/oxidase [Cellulosimicrobium funkei]